MFQNKQKNLAEVCPQCYKLIDSTANRLVHDTCGHLKCRICLLQEITGCLLCVAANKTPEKTVEKANDATSGSTEKTKVPDAAPQQRKSVITSLAIQIAEQKQKEENKSVDKDTCHLIKQSLEKDILFPTDIVKRSTGNFYHLKRIFSQRFFNEHNNKKHKACETEEKWADMTDKGNKSDDENVERNGWKIPGHIQVQYYCNVHKATLEEKSTVLKHHMTCTSDPKKAESSQFLCKICGRSYNVIGKLNRHMKVHTMNSRFKCKKCGKACTDNYALRTHERSHTQQKPYSCQYCDKKFSGVQNYKRHEKKHRNEKSFVCNDCGFRFITKAELKRHGVTHTNLKPFICSVCSTKFAFKRTLARHIRTHDSNMSKMKCSQCDSTFKRKDNLERHMKTAHTDAKSDSTEEDSAGQ